MEHKWYVIKTVTGHENKVKTLLEHELKDNEKLQAKVTEILIPMEKVFEVKDGKKKSKTKNLLPGHMLINCEMDAAVKEFILTTTSVLGFVGNGRLHPTALPAHEVKALMSRANPDAVDERMETLFRHGDTVKIVNGPFKSFAGQVEEVNEEKMKIKVMVPILGRKTPVEIDFDQAELEK
ncbi:MAG: transcription termination/antitermination factor NusG [Ignavibacteriaceae bacterium]|nr:transcription termination/antitermination factor NusG [Ignavibacteriaceae bacterium]